MCQKFYQGQMDDNFIVTPQMLEKSFRIGYNGLTFSGKIDGVFDGLVVDYKTGRRVVEDISKDHQLTLYSLAYRSLTNNKERGLCLYYVRMNKKLYTERDEDDYKVLCEKCAKFLENLAKGNFDYTSNQGQCKWCEVSKYCLRGEGYDKKEEV